MRRPLALELGLVLAAVLLSACFKDDPLPTVTPDAGAGAMESCLDRPTDLAHPPTDKLPCELLPPGFAPQAR